MSKPKFYGAAMHVLTAEPITKQDQQANIDGWVASLNAPLLSRLMPVRDDQEASGPADSTSAKAKRQLEFANGRRCAESLLKRLGNTNQVWTNDDRSPAWPLGYTGSISHSRNWTWAAVTQKSRLNSVGIDTEPVIDTQTREEIIFEVATPAEWKACQETALTDDQLFSLIFSAKEAFYKCCYPIVQQYFGFEHAVAEIIDEGKIKIRTHQSHPCFGQMPQSLEVHYRFTPENVFTITWMEPA